MRILPVPDFFQHITTEKKIPDFILACKTQGLSLHKEETVIRNLP